MYTKRMFFDIETVANPVTLVLMPDPKAPGNLKDPEKIRAAIEEKRQEQIANAALDPDYGRVLSFGYATVPNEIYVHVVGPEYNEVMLLNQFWRIFDECQGNCCGYNILNFDLPFLMRRSMALDVKVPRLPFLARYRTEPVTDLMQILYNWGSSQFKGLKQVVKLYGVSNPLPDYDGSQVKDMPLETLVAYQENDVRLVMGLFSKMRGIYF